MRLGFSLSVLLVGLTLGCGSNSTPTAPDMGGDDGTAVARSVEELNEAVGIPAKVEKLFATGSTPKDLKKLTEFSYSVSGKPSISGTTATCKVRLDDQKSGSKVGEPEWTFEKVGDKWLIKNAPLS